MLVRSDLRGGEQFAQLGHAAGETAGGPLPEDTSVVVLWLPSEGAMRHMSQRMTSADVEHKLIVEPHGRIADQATAIGCKPVVKGSPEHLAIRKLTSDLPLAGGKGCRCCRSMNGGR